MRMFDSKNKLFFQFEWVEKFLSKNVYPLSIEIDPSNKCPLNCTYCVWSGYLDKDKSELSRKDLFSIVKQIKNLGIKSIIWSGGGESFSNQNTVDAIVYAHKLGIENGIFSNGVLLIEEVADILKDCIKWIRFNIGGSNAEEYSIIHNVPEKIFFQAKNNIDYFCSVFSDIKRCGIGVAVNYENFHFVKNIFNLGKEMKIGYIQIKPDFFMIRQEEYENWWNSEVFTYFSKFKKDKNINLFISKIKKQKNKSKYCYASFLTSCISANGDVNFCKAMRNKDEVCLGNIKDNSLKEIYNNKKRKRIINIINPENCQETMHCPYVEVNNYLNRLYRNYKKIDEVNINFF